VFLRTLGIEEQGEAGLKRLRDVEAQKLVEASAQMLVNGSVWLSVQEQQWFGNMADSVTWDRIPELIGNCEWVDEIVVGTTGFEVRLQPVTREKLSSNIWDRARQ